MGYMFKVEDDGTTISTDFVDPLTSVKITDPSGLSVPAMLRNRMKTFGMNTLVIP